MKTTKYLRTAALALAGLVATYGCAKKETDAPSPQARQPESGLARAKDAWNAFVARVEGGQAADPLGQYVSKATQVANGDGTAARPTRAKYDAAAPGTLPKDKNGKVVRRPLPEDECPSCSSGGGGYYPPAVTSTFVSSEGVALNGDPIDNPLNQILNATVIKGDDANIAARAGYTKLNLDLNKGVGGKYIYLCFTRQSGQYADTAPWNQEAGIYGSVSFIDKRPITGIDAIAYGFLRTLAPYRWPAWDYVYNYHGIYPQYWKNADLNDGAGGKYIYALVTKGFEPQGLYQSPPKVPIRNVGVISGNSASIQPPAGWNRSNQDLNEGAGGDYIYLCWQF